MGGGEGGGTPNRPFFSNRIKGFKILINQIGYITLENKT